MMTQYQMDPTAVAAAPWRRLRVLLKPHVQPVDQVAAGFDWNSALDEAIGKPGWSRGARRGTLEEVLSAV